MERQRIKVHSQNRLKRRKLGKIDRRNIFCFLARVRSNHMKFCIFLYALIESRPVMDFNMTSSTEPCAIICLTERFSNLFSLLMKAEVMLGCFYVNFYDPLHYTISWILVLKLCSYILGENNSTQCQARPSKTLIRTRLSLESPCS